jgi:hypothetical protein
MNISLQQFIDVTQSRDINACVRIMNYAHQFMCNNVFNASYIDATLTLHAFDNETTHDAYDELCDVVDAFDASKYATQFDREQSRIAHDAMICVMRVYDILTRDAYDV